MTFTKPDGYDFYENQSLIDKKMLVLFADKRLTSTNFRIIEYRDDTNKYYILTTRIELMDSNYKIYNSETKYESGIVSDLSLKEIATNIINSQGQTASIYKDSKTNISIINLINAPSITELLEIHLSELNLKIDSKLLVVDEEGESF